MPPRLLDATSPLGAALPSPALGFSVLSYNVLLPNSAQHGWWIPKFYDPAIPPEHRSWPHRQALLRQGILAAAPDLLCLQETTPECFPQDWSFLAEAGYDHVVHRKGDLRCATFWRTSAFSLASEPRHLDRVLLLSLSARHTDRVLQVANVHLKAGPEPRRRLQQISDTLDQMAKRGPGPAILCGDFNCEVAGSAVGHLLLGREVSPEFREPERPHEALTSRVKKNPFGPFLDAYQAAFAPHDAPATLLLPDRERFFFDEQGAVSVGCIQAIQRLFARFAAGSPEMDRRAVDAWIEAVNGAPGRGSEWSKAREIFEARGVEALRCEDMEKIYTMELAEGKPWGIVHDLARCGALAEAPPHRLLRRRFDQIHGAGPLELEAVRAVLTPEQEAWVQQGQTLPGSWHPSDHLPVGAVYRWCEGEGAGESACAGG
ncbi:MAG: endonuclease/exonuclease/phosphatase family protein [Polyangiaceae bacterium]|jgi:exonuclease III|nr:endonuclease/exonuclease/phosphatase family protein [Polyangiaceae bacterium]